MPTVNILVDWKAMLDTRGGIVLASKKGEGELKS
jgi:hypothetical protein